MTSARNVWMAINATSGLGPAAVQKLMRRLSERGLPVQELLGLSGDEVRQVTGLSESLSFALAHELIDVDRFDVSDERLLTPDDPDYPEHLIVGANPPLPAVLWTVGRRSLLTEGSPVLAIAGSRDATEDLLGCAHEIGSHCAQRGWLVVSGLAAGVDSAAHQGVLDRGGSTIGVLANGISVRGRHWQPETLDETCILSQFNPTDPWSGPRAMQRNATIAALSDRVVIVASGDSGGSWEMGQLCLKRNKPLFVLDVDTVSAAGNQRLIAAGATPVPTGDMDALFSPLEMAPESPTLF